VRTAGRDSGCGLHREVIGAGAPGNHDEAFKILITKITRQ